MFVVSRTMFVVVSRTHFVASWWLHEHCFVASHTRFSVRGCPSRVRGFQTMFVVPSRTHFVASMNIVRGGLTNTVLWLPTHVSLFVAARTQFVASKQCSWWLHEPLRGLHEHGSWLPLERLHACSTSKLESILTRVLYCLHLIHEVTVGLSVQHIHIVCVCMLCTVCVPPPYLSLK